MTGKLLTFMCALLALVSWAQPDSTRQDLRQAEVRGGRGLEKMELRAVESGSIFSGMKSQLIQPGSTPANLSTSNSRQVYAKVAGLNIWESDGAGIQLGIGARGLSPNRTSHFNVRQNGYDISADPLGYPESYYSPPLEAIDRIELVRGAAALQFGTQFGGLLNFRFKQGSLQEKMGITLRQTVGSYGIADSLTPVLSSFNTALEIRGNIRGRTRYYGFLQRKSGTGWRPNSGYEVTTAHANLWHDLSEKAELAFEFTHMDYLAAQAGGLLDSQFNQNARRSFRERNWFAVNWNLIAAHFNLKLTSLTELRTTIYGLDARRQALGFLGQAGRVDNPELKRDLIWGDFRHGGMESRLLHRYMWKDRIAVALIGVRLFRGDSRGRQGLASAGFEQDFNFQSPSLLEGSDYALPNSNVAFFTQHILPLTQKLSITPGLRFETIDTRADGYYREFITNGAGEVIEDSVFQDTRASQRSFVLAGIGLSWKSSANLEVYANAVQNYRAINFSDIQVRGLGLVVDPEIKDERGGNLDLGIRGNLKQKVQFDLSVFALLYRDRIGTYNTTVSDPVLVQRVVRFRSNVADARILGFESLVQGDLLALFKEKSETALELFVNTSLIQGEYIDSDEPAFDGNRVELVPTLTMKTGLTLSRPNWAIALQYSYTAEQYSDATNASFTPNAVDGIIPAYQLLDFSGNLTRGPWKMEVSINNVLDTRYFTRRAAGYPGPGIIPGDGRALYLTLAYTWVQPK